MESEDDYLTSDAELDTDVEEDLEGQEQELGVWLDQLNRFQQVSCTLSHLKGNKIIWYGIRVGEWHQNLSECTATGP